MPALPPLVAPLAVVVVVAFCVACALSAPPVARLRSGPVPIEAVVVTFEIAIATCAERARLPVPAEAPPSALVVIVSFAAALRVRFLSVVSCAPLATSDDVVSLTTFTATDAPIPLALPSPDCLASAVALLAMFEVELSFRSPAIETGDDAASLTSAVVVDRATLTAIEPATPTPLLPPAPEVEWAVKLDWPLPGPCASTVTPPPASRLRLPAR